VRAELKTEFFGKASRLSTLQARRWARGRSESFGEDRIKERPLRNRGEWLSFLGFDALPAIAALALVWLATITLVVIKQFTPFDPITLIYMLPVVVAATQWGIIPAMIAAVAGAAAADFFFFPPLYSFWIRDPQNVVDLILFLLVALATGNLTARLKKEAVVLGRRETQIRELHAFSQGLATCLTSRDLIFAVQDYLSNALRHRAALIATQPDHHDHAHGLVVPEEVRRRALELSAAQGKHPSALVGPQGSNAWFVRVISPEILGYGAIAVELEGRPSEQITEVAERLERLLEEAMTTLRHLRVKEAIEQATISYRTEILRDALIGGVSHELRTPLAAILGSCSVLSEIPAIAGDQRTTVLVSAIGDEASQLDNQIRNLLDATRVSAKGVLPQLIWTDPHDIVSSALKQKQRRLSAHRVRLDLAGDLPLVHVDPVLVEQALGQLLDNAAKYSPIGSEIAVSGRCQQGGVVLSVRDQGSGLTADEQSHLGKHSLAGRRSKDAAGSGLGLWIAAAFVAANGGSLHAESGGQNFGATVSLRLPSAAADMAELMEAIDD
jgi:K+-sensing histidine kinase KdpD